MFMIQSKGLREIIQKIDDERDRIRLGMSKKDNDPHPTASDDRYIDMPTQTPNIKSKPIDFIPL